MIPRPAPGIAEKYITLQNLSSVPIRVVRQGILYLSFQVLDVYFWPCSIRRSSAFKNHLKKHGLDPGKYSTRDHSPTKVRGSTEPKGIREGQVFSFHGSSSNQEIPLASLPNSWDSFFLDSRKSIILPVPRPERAQLIFYDILSASIAAAPLAMQPELTSGIPCSQPLLLAPSPRIAPDYNGGYYLSPPRASPEASSRYSSPMAPTPALTPETVPGFTSDVSLQLSPCRATPRLDTSAWQDHGIWFVG